ncbi:MAG: tyrosine-protein phosphatase [Nitrospirae bacterium]|nr:tyrosine-protein phosphatase [Nitrospirota bacterium]
MGVLDAGDSAAFSSIFLASSFSCSQALSTSTLTPVTQTVGLQLDLNRHKDKYALYGRRWSMIERVLVWDGCTNVRDLGGLRTCDGRAPRWGAVVRSDTPARLTEAGWSALYAYGIRTIITLRTHGKTEDELNITPPHSDIVTVQVAIEDLTDMEFLQKWAASDLWCTPLYYADVLRRWPERHAAAISAVAQARPGGVLFHCVRGNDRTGIIALLLLALAGVTPDEIIADYELSPDPDRDELLAREHSSVRDALLSALEGLNIERYLSMGGVSQDELAAVRKRLACGVESPTPRVPD